MMREKGLRGTFCRTRITSGKLYDVRCKSLSEYAEPQHNSRTAQAEFCFPSVKSFEVSAFFGGAGAPTSQRAINASRLSIIQRVTIADALASIQASSSTRIAFAKLFERFSSASSASSNERLLASNRKSICGSGIGPFPWDEGKCQSLGYPFYIPTLSLAQSHYSFGTPSGESKA